MASMVRVLVIAAMSALLVELSMAVTHNVGGSNGWDASSSMQTWGSSQTFSVGDSLVFQYSPNHDVTEVSKFDYDNCAAGNALQSFSDGNTVITLSAPGKRYFICGAPAHCSIGMKLEVDTLAVSAPPTLPTVLPTVTSPPPTESPTLSPTLETPTDTSLLSGVSPIPPPQSSANKISFALGFGFGFVMLFAL